MEAAPIEVLLVEDEPTHAALIRRAFQNSGQNYRLVAVERLATARDYLASHTPGAAIVDLVLPDGRGIDLLPLTGDPPRFPTILLTSQGDERAAVAAIKAGAFDYVIKSSAVVADMPNIIRQALRQWQLVVEREAARLALAESEERFRQLSEHIRDIFWLYDFSQQKLLYVSPAFETVWGRPRQWLYDDPSQWFTPVHEDDRLRIKQLSSTRRAEAHFDHVYRIVRPDGQIRWIHDRRFAICNAAGERFRLAGVAEDVTERQEASEKLHEQGIQLTHVARLSTLGELVAGIAHEVNQPLYAIANFAATTSAALKDEKHLPLPDLRRWNADILKSALRAGDIIKRIRAYVSKTPAHRMPVNMSTLIEEAVELVAFEARRERVSVELNLLRPTPVVVADAIGVQQVLVNLLRNAFDAQRETRPSERLVTIRTAVAENLLVVSVSDQGCGIAENLMDRLFTTFYTSKPEGMGMGLAISKTILDAHHGQIWATRNETRGMTFHFSLEIVPAAGEMSPREPSTIASPPPVVAVAGNRQT